MAIAMHRIRIFNVGAMKEKDFLPKDTAILLREKGFDWEDSPFRSKQEMEEWRYCNNYNVPNPCYNPDLPFDSETISMIAPHVSIQDAMSWLRKIHHFHVWIPMTNHSLSTSFDIPKYYWVVSDTRTCKWIDESTLYSAKQFDVYEEACMDAIRHLLEKIAEK